MPQYSSSTCNLHTFSKLIKSDFDNFACLLACLQEEQVSASHGIPDMTAAIPRLSSYLTHGNLRYCECDITKTPKFYKNYVGLNHVLVYHQNS